MRSPSGNSIPFAPEQFDDREITSILAGLRLLQSTPFHQLPDDILQIVTDGGILEALSNDEIDDLCEKINV